MTANATSHDPTGSKSILEGLDPLDVCTLPKIERSERLTWIREEILPFAVGAHRSADAITWELRDAPGLAARLDSLIALERECCAGITLQHAPSTTRGQRRFEVRGIDPSSELFSAVQFGPAERERLSRRLAKAAGFGTALSLMVCCVAPIAATALLGAAAAAPFTSLDTPWIIGGAAVLAGGASFGWQNRRARSAPASADTSTNACGPDC
jgi:hypothetical protein